MKRILIVGATSAIAMACARIWASEGARFFLVARDAERVRQSAADLIGHGAGEAHTHILDANHTAGHADMVELCFAALGSLDVALIAHGTLSDQALCATQVPAAMLEFETNATSVIALLTLLGTRMVSAGGGTLGVISSVAGDRGRASNYVYGSAKAAVTAYCEGMRARLHGRGVHVVTIKPGPVLSPMTAGTKIPGFLLASPPKVARDIVRGIAQQVQTLYTPWFWRPIMLLICALPEAVLRRLPL